mmetsp:Transcript_19494/g.25346  ORF Transcript_19494/g.25346 Transcript_19494/m.25346 type:complete len:82 (+) Transcript_19494:373-618(+)
MPLPFLLDLFVRRSTSWGKHASKQDEAFSFDYPRKTSCIRSLDTRTFSVAWMRLGSRNHEIQQHVTLADDASEVLQNNGGN